MCVCVCVCVHSTEVAYREWLAYPKYTPPEKLEHFVLDASGGLLYINCVEQVP